MDGEKLEPRLEQELARAEAAGLADQPIPVLIELDPQVRAISGGERKAALTDLEQRTVTMQKALLEHLAKLKAQNVQRSSLVNAVSAELTPEQIRMVAARGDVRMVRLARMEQVTASS